MHAYLAIALAVAVLAHADPLPRDRFGYEREIDATRFNQVPKLQDYVLSDEYLAAQKNRAKLITKYRPDEAIAADNVKLESNMVRIIRPAKRRVATQAGAELVRRRRGYNLENVNVPARSPYLPVPSYYRLRCCWG